MASPGGFPAADVQKELNPGLDKDFQVDPVSSDVATSKEINNALLCTSFFNFYISDANMFLRAAGQYEAAERKEEEKKDALQSLKTAIIVSGIVVAVAGAVFAITKKLREK
ncbi:hypothetical protein Pfo_028459 [Paulownia fortunei]|nr:hypothetical protein Pfo_028459 [Paulownia fortunei]